MNIQTVLNELASQGLNRGSYVTEAQISDAMNRLIQKHVQSQGGIFSPTVATEIWEQCNLNDNWQANVGQYAQVIMDAKGILESRVKETSQKLQILHNQRKNYQQQSINYRTSGNEAALNGLRARLAEIDDQIRDCELDLNDYNQDYKAITMPFINDPNASMQNFSRQNMSINRSLVPGLLPGNNSYVPELGGGGNTSFRAHSQIFMKRSSTALTILFYLTLLAFILELLISIHKFHFVSLLAILSVIAIFGLNYFDKNYIRLSLGVLFLSVIFQIIWILFYLGQYASPGAFSQNSTIHSSWLRFTLFLVLVNAVAKAIIFLILFAYRNVQQGAAITVFGYSITLSGQCGPLRSWELFR